MERERLISLLQAVRSLRAEVFRIEQELLSALTAEQIRCDAPESQRGNASDDWFTLAELGD